jgi:ribonuclease HII
MSIAAPELVCGVDEAGRGPLAGPVIAAAVVLDPGRPIPGLRDSKLLTAAQRQRLADTIRTRAIAWSIGRAEHEEIDAINILQASLCAMQRAIDALRPAAHFALVDGNRLPVLAIPALALIGGDRIEPAIAAASILAKTVRDEVMRGFDGDYPGYGFSRHFGYATEAHVAALTRLGPCAIHRRSFAPVRAMLQIRLLE